ncbi:TonB-dependent receptor [Aquisediminimonas sediminicola]|uniref:TonB-dependent receptor n=1 Tax=Alteraquisediminimonas sediminicola TaxID=2676787 RepID=UPI001FE908D7|nr:TonB-dependent receptor [Aquisediminimonas sediminicola]
MKNTYITHALFMAMAASAFAVPSLAQETNAVADQADSGGLEEIVVSARRRNETVQDTPVAVTAISPSQLEASAALTIGDLQGAAPNVLITSAGTGAAAANISIRGIAFADIEKSFDPAVGVNIDGVYIGTSTGQMLDFFDIGSIEILRGPQGTLFGRNTIAGVVNIKRSRPTGEFGGKFEASYGSYDQMGLRGVLNVPVIKDVLAAKFFAFHNESDGYYKTVGTGQRRGGSNNENFGASFLFTPGDRFESLLTFDKQVQDFDPILGPLSRTGDAFAGALPAEFVDGNNTDNVYRVVAPSQQMVGTYSSPGVTNEMNLDLDVVKLTSVTAYRESDDQLRQDYSTTGLYFADRDQQYKQFSQELRASGKLFDGFDYVAGVYYFNSRYHIDQFTSVFFGAPTHQDTTGWSKSYAGFVDFNWEVMDKVRISGGGRYTYDKKKLQTAFTDPSNAGASFTGDKNSECWKKFTPKLGVDYRPNEDLMVYGSWSRGYRSGGFNGRGLTPFASALPYDPETVDAYEIGLKSEFFDRRLTLNLAAFYSDYQDIQQTTTVSVPGVALPQTIVSNAANAKIKGLEADFSAKPMDRLTVRGSVGYTDSKFKGFIVNQPVATGPTTSISRSFDFSAVDMIYAPKITASINAEYKLPLGPGDLKLNAGYRYLSRYDQQISADPALYPTALASAPTDIITVAQNDPRLRSDAQNLLDASVSYVFSLDNGLNYRLTGYVRNLLDDRGTNTSFVASNFPVYWGFATAREPRVFGVQLGVDF